MADDGLDATDLYPSIPRAVGLYSLLVHQVRQEGLEVKHQPLWTNWYHGGICGQAIQGNAGHKVRKRLAKACVPVIEIDTEAAKAFAPAKTPDPHTPTTIG